MDVVRLVEEVNLALLMPVVVESGILEDVLSELGGEENGASQEAGSNDDAVDFDIKVRANGEPVESGIATVDTFKTIQDAPSPVKRHREQAIIVANPSSSVPQHLNEGNDTSMVSDTRICCATSMIIETPPSTPATVPNPPKLKHLFRHQKNDWTAHIKAANTLDDLLTLQGIVISSDSQQSITDSSENGPTFPHNNRAPARVYKSNAEAYIEALRDTRNAQSRACQKRQSLRKQGLPYKHIVSPRLRHVLAERGILRPNKLARSKDDQRRPTSTHIETSTKDNVPQALEPPVRLHDEASHSQRQGLNPFVRSRKRRTSASSSSNKGSIHPSDEVQDHPSMLDDDDHSSAHSSSASDSDCDMRASGPRRVWEGFQRKKEIYLRLAGRSQEEIQARMNAPNSSRKRKRASTNTWTSTPTKLRRLKNPALLPRTPSPMPTADVSPSPPCGQSCPTLFPSREPLPTPPHSVACTPGSVVIDVDDLTAIDLAVSATDTRLSRTQVPLERVSQGLME